MPNFKHSMLTDRATSHPLAGVDDGNKDTWRVYTQYQLGLPQQETGYVEHWDPLPVPREELLSLLSSQIIFGSWRTSFREDAPAEQDRRFLTPHGLLSGVLRWKAGNKLKIEGRPRHPSTNEMSNWCSDCLAMGLLVGARISTIPPRDMPTMIFLSSVAVKRAINMTPSHIRHCWPLN